MRRYALAAAGVIVASLVIGSALVEAGKPAPQPTSSTNLVVGRPAKGMYCADPAGWIKAGYRIFVWGNATPVKAQALDKDGHMINPSTGISWTVQGTNETGTMSIIDSANKVYGASPKSLAATNLFTGDSNITYTADGKSFPGVIRRWNSTCDGCHAAPPPHALQNAGSNGNSTCRTCHADFGALMMKSHAHRVPVSEQTTSAGCYRCHPSPCYGGIHKDKFPNDSIGCVTCHGDMIDAANGRMKVPGQLGYPKCQDCHTSARRQPIPYATNSGVEFKSSVGHGKSNAAKVLCITCHNSMHMETKPMSWGDGRNNNCTVCHVNQPAANNMGIVCGNCHVNSFDPHLVQK